MILIQFQRIPLGASAAVVTSRLLDIDEALRQEEQEATAKNLSLDQHKRRSAKEQRLHESRRMAVVNGKSRLDTKVEHLKKLSSHLTLC